MSEKHAIGKKNQEYSKRGNVMTPLNWACGCFETLLIPMASHNHNNWLGCGLFILACVILLFYGFMYFFFAKKEPNRLQTEEYNLAIQEIAIKQTNNIQLTSDQKPVITESYKNLSSVS